MAPGNRRIAPTAHFTGQAWVVAGFPNAELFDTLEGRLLFGATQRLIRRLGKHAPSLPWHLEFLYLRHRAFEARLRQLAPDYVLEVGAGLSARGLTLASQWPNAIYVEVDLPSMVAEKERCIAATRRPENYVLASCDVLDPMFASRLPRLPKPGDRAVIVAEGLMDYLEMDDKRRAYSSLRRVLEEAGGGTFLFEAYTRQRLGKYPLSVGASLRLLSLLVGGSFERRLFANADEALAAVRGSGFDAARVLDAEALDAGREHPPADYRHFELIEAGLGR